MGASLELIVAVFRGEGTISQILRELRALNMENVVDVFKEIGRLIAAAFRGPGRASKVLRELRKLDEQYVVLV